MRDFILNILGAIVHAIGFLYAGGFLLAALVTVTTAFVSWIILRDRRRRLQHALAIAAFVIVFSTMFHQIVMGLFYIHYAQQNVSQAGSYSDIGAWLTTLATAIVGAIVWAVFRRYIWIGLALLVWSVAFGILVSS